jgi:hypothetical protein
MASAEAQGPSVGGAGAEQRLRWLEFGDKKFRGRMMWFDYI